MKRDAYIIGGYNKHPKDGFYPGAHWKINEKGRKRNSESELQVHPAIKRMPEHITIYGRYGERIDVEGCWWTVEEDGMKYSTQMILQNYIHE